MMRARGVGRDDGRRNGLDDTTFANNGSQEKISNLSDRGGETGRRERGGAMKKATAPQRLVGNNDFAIFLGMVIFLLILFSLPPLVEGNRCNRHGLLNASVNGGDGECICNSGYYGQTCDRR